MKYKFREPKVRWVRWWERLMLLHKPMHVGSQEGHVIWYKIRGLGLGGRMLVYHAVSAPNARKVRIKDEQPR